MDKASTSIDTIASNCIAVRLRLLNRVVTNFYDDALRPLGLKVSQLNLLIVTAKLGLAQRDCKKYWEDLDPEVRKYLLGLNPRGLSMNLRFDERSLHVASCFWNVFAPEEYFIRTIMVIHRSDLECDEACFLRTGLPCRGLTMCSIRFIWNGSSWAGTGLTMFMSFTQHPTTIVKCIT
jgi:hypothetical protein